jgi:methionyl-tRNA formyltransferase
MTGITIMRVVKVLDAGPMLATISRPIGSEDTSVDVERDLAQLGAVALVKVADRLSAGDVTETPQDESTATYAHKLQKSDGVIDWSASAAAIHNQIRGLHPWPHAFTELEGARCLLLQSRVDDAKRDRESFSDDRDEKDSRSLLDPGTIVAAGGEDLKVQTGDGILNILRLQMEGRRALTAHEFLTGHRLAAGTKFTRSAP